MGTNVIQVSYNCFLIFTFYGRREKNKSFSSSEEDNELVFAFRSADVNYLS